MAPAGKGMAVVEGICGAAAGQAQQAGASMPALDTRASCSYLLDVARPGHLFGGEEGQDGALHAVIQVRHMHEVSMCALPGLPLISCSPEPRIQGTASPCSIACIGVSSLYAGASSAEMLLQATLPSKGLPDVARAYSS